ncbi:uncharacterized protein LOC130419743 isoform X1 [Triplophysa dalaica]|uniref:uncharacterized protein LOC130419743 isoform X1 n=2 Tax=Triplophysa dalaica TaxID=1582913 RepID=UPI0024DF7DAD|nr:uncharacterized protein LOC130419743 isoform X1 [Triplophysa dalaica]
MTDLSCKKHAVSCVTPLVFAYVFNVTLTLIDWPSFFTFRKTLFSPKISRAILSRMAGTTFKRCSSCNVHIAVACKTCKHCGQKQAMKEAVKAAKSKVNAKWVSKMKSGCNSCKLINSAHVLIHKLHAVGKFPFLLLGKRNASGSFTVDVVTAHSFSTIQEQNTLDTLKNIFSSLLKVKYSAQRDLAIEEDPLQGGEPSNGTGGKDTTISPEGVDVNDLTRENSTMTPEGDDLSEEDTTITALEDDLTGEDSTITPHRDNLSDLTCKDSTITPEGTDLKSVTEGDVVTLILTPVEISSDISSDPTSALQPPIKKRILQRLPAFCKTGLPVPTLCASPALVPGIKTPTAKLTPPEFTMANALPAKANELVTKTLESPKSSTRMRYKIKDCPVHLNQEHFPVLKTLGVRISQHGEKEIKVRWQPCSGCGAKWKDTWEPYELFQTD